MMNLRVRQQGVALVENALTMALFLMLIMAILEFSLLMYVWSRGVEAARSASRYAIVSDAIIDLTLLDCAGGAASEVLADCSGGDSCEELMTRVRAFLPQAQPENVIISYSCSGTGFVDRPGEMVIPEVQVEISNLEYQMIIPALFGFPRDWVLPSMTSTRTGEDMETILAP